MAINPKPFPKVEIPRSMLTGVDPRIEDEIYYSLTGAISSAVRKDFERSAVESLPTVTIADLLAAMRVVEESRRTIICPPALRQQVEEFLDEYTGGRWTVMVSHYIPPDRMYVMPHQPPIEDGQEVTDTPNESQR